MGIDRPLWALATAGLICGCAEDTTSGTGNVDGSGMDLSCPGAMEFEPGITLEASGTGQTFAIVTAAPAPPDVGDNFWTLSVNESDGEPYEGTVVVRPWMPLHGHGTTPPAFEGSASADGTFEIEPFDLFMPGLWEITVAVGANDAEASDEVVFAFCVEG